MFFFLFLQMFGSILLFGTRGRQSTQYVGSQFAHKHIIKVILTYDVFSFWENLSTISPLSYGRLCYFYKSLKLLYLLHFCYFQKDIALSSNLLRASSFFFFLNIYLHFVVM